MQLIWKYLLIWSTVTVVPARRATATPADHRDAFYRKPSIWSAVYRRDFLEREGIRFIATKVGDRFVMEEMLLEEYSFGAPGLI